MSKVVRVLASACLMLALQVLTTSSAYGQGGTTSTLSGVAVDSSGAILPGADVTIKHGRHGVHAERAVTNTEGAFSFPGLNVGTLHRDGHALRLQDVRRQQRRPHLRCAGERPGDARDRRASKSRSSSRRRLRSSRPSRRLFRRRSTPTRSLKLPLTTPQRDGFCECSCRASSTPGGNRDVDDQRPAAAA